MNSKKKIYKKRKKLIKCLMSYFKLVPPGFV